VKIARHFVINWEHFRPTQTPFVSLFSFVILNCSHKKHTSSYYIYHSYNLTYILETNSYEMCSLMKLTFSNIPAKIFKVKGTCKASPSSSVTETRNQRSPHHIITLLWSPTRWGWDLVQCNNDIKWERSTNTRSSSFLHIPETISFYRDCITTIMSLLLEAPLSLLAKEACWGKTGIL